MEAYNRFNRCIFEWNQTLLILVGHNFLAEKFERNLITFIVYGLFIIIFTSLFYTFIFFDPLTKVFALIFFLIALQGLVKVFHITYVDDLQWIIRFVQSLYKTHIKTTSPERKEYFANFALATEILFKFMTTVYIVSIFTFFPYPIYMYFFKNEVVPLLPIYLPFVDHSTFIGYIILNTFQIIIVSLATFGFLAADFFFTIISVSTLIFGKLTSLEMKQICAELQTTKIKAMLFVKGRFRNLLLMHQEMINYMKRVEMLTDKMFFAQVATASVGAVITLYVILAWQYVPVYGLVVGLFFQIFIACLMGNFVELAQDKFYESALLLDYDRLPIKERRMYLFLIQSAQKPTLLSIGGLAPLNLATCVTIFSRIFSITMLILTMVLEND